MHVRDQRLFRINVRRLMEKSKYEAACRAVPLLRQQAALLIQRFQRAACARTLGRVLLQTARKKKRDEWHEQRIYSSKLYRASLSLRDDALVWACTVTEQLVLQRIAFWK